MEDEHYGNQSRFAKGRGRHDTNGQKQPEPTQSNNTEREMNESLETASESQSSITPNEEITTTGTEDDNLGNHEAYPESNESSHTSDNYDEEVTLTHGSVDVGRSDAASAFARNSLLRYLCASSHLVHHKVDVKPCAVA